MAIETFAVIRAYGAAVEGEAVVFLDGFSPRYDLDRVTGVISKIGHAQEGRSLSGKILVIPSAKGGVAAGWAFSDMKAKGFAPRGFGLAEPIRSWCRARSLPILPSRKAGPPMSSGAFGQAIVSGSIPRVARFEFCGKAALEEDAVIMTVPSSGPGPRAAPV